MTKEQSNVLKGIAIMMVVFCHFGNALGTRITTPLGGIGVAIFLFLSGYGLSKSYIAEYHKLGKGLYGYWRKRLIGVCIPYAVFEILTWKFQSGGTVLDFVLDVLLIKPRFSLGWYLNYLLSWYILFWVVHFALEQLKIDIQGKAELIMLLLSILMGVKYLQNGLQFEQMFSFSFGVICAYEAQWLKRFLHPKWIISLFVIAFTLLVAKQVPFIRVIMETGPAVLDLIMKTSAAFGIILFYLKTCKFRGWKVLFNPIGLVSFELYLVHGVALIIFDTSFSVLMQIILFILISLIGSGCMYLLDTYICEKLKRFARL